MKGYKNNIHGDTGNKNSNISEKKFENYECKIIFKKKGLKNKEDIKNYNNISEKKNEIKDNISSSKEKEITSEIHENYHEEEDMHSETNTLKQADEILLKFSQGKNNKNTPEEEEDDDDLDDYIKNLENKA